MCCRPKLHHHLLLLLCRLVHFPSFKISGGALLPTSLCLISLRVTIFSLGVNLPCSIISSGSVLRQLQLITPVSSSKWVSCLLRELYNHLLVVLFSIPMCLLFLSILVVFVQHLTLSSLIVICTTLLLRCLLSDMFDNLFKVIMLSPFNSRMLIYVFLLLSMIIIFYNLFSKICHISGKFYPCGWPQPWGFHCSQ